MIESDSEEEEEEEFDEEPTAKPRSGRSRRALADIN